METVQASSNMASDPPDPTLNYKYKIVFFHGK